MYDAFLERTRISIDSLRRHLATSERIQGVMFDDQRAAETGSDSLNELRRAGVPDKLEWRVIDHCAAVTRIYAIYEHFAHEIIRERLVLLQQNFLFSQLPSGVRTAYRIGLSRILEKKESPRFKEVILPDLVQQYRNALHDEEYAFEPAAFLLQEQNLRLPELGRLMAGCGVEGIEGWIEKHQRMVGFFHDSDRLTNSAESELAELIKYRNEAAHGGIVVDDVLGLNVLLEFCDFVQVLCESLAERVQLVGLEDLEKKQLASYCGIADTCIKGELVIAGYFTGTFKKGQTIYLRGEGYCLERRIMNIQMENLDKEEVIASLPTDLGFLLDKAGKRNAKVLILTPAKSAPNNLASENTASASESTAGAAEAN